MKLNIWPICLQHTKFTIKKKLKVFKCSHCTTLQNIHNEQIRLVGFVFAHRRAD